MPEDDTLKRQNYALETIEAVKRLMQAETDLYQLVYSIAQQGLTYVQADFDNHPKLRHLTPAELTAVASSSDALRTWLSTTNHEDNFHKVILNP